MSCNHKPAIQAYQKAKDLRALHKWLMKAIELSPKAMSEAWEAVDLAGHLCPVCRKSSLFVYESNFKCPECLSIVEKEGR